MLKTLPSGSSVRIKDVARVEIGAEQYNVILRMSGYPGAGMQISLTPGADALKTADLVKAKMEELAPQPARRARLRLCQRHLDLHPPVGERSAEGAARGGRAGRAGDVRVPAELARAAGADGGGAGGAARHAGGVLPRRLQHQHADPVRAGAGDRPAGRRRDRGGRERRAADGREPRHDRAGGDHQVDGRAADRADRDRAGAVARCSCRWRSSAARPA